MPNLEYPAFFDDGTMGFKAKKTIDHRELIIAVPYSIVMSNHKAMEIPELCQIFEENDEIFGKKEQNEHDNYILTVFLMYELQKGKNSFWAPYIDYLPKIQFFSLWPKEI